MNEAIIVLETYAPAGGMYDGLTVLQGHVRGIGESLEDTRHLAGRKVLVSGIPFLYEGRLSSLNTNILFTAFESDTLPDFWVEAINRSFQHCLVPHPEIATVFRHSGVHIPVTTVSMGFSRLAGSRCREGRRAPFVLGFLGVPVKRKNVLKLYAVCRQLKRDKIPDLELAVHVSTWYDWLDERAFREMKSDPMVRWTTTKYNDRQMAEWFDSLSCYIFPSSGEGWSNTPRESLSVGVPTIITDIPVHRELVESNHCRTIPVRGKEKADFDGHVFGEWAHIDEADIAEAILDVYQHYPQYLQAAANGAAWIADKWHYDQMRQQLAAFIDSLSQQ